MPNNPFNPAGAHAFAGARARHIQSQIRPGAAGGPNELREVISDGQIEVSAKAELAKLGISIKSEHGNDRRALLAQRAELRRAINAVRDTCDRSKPESYTDDKINALDWLGAQVNLISNELDLQEIGENPAGFGVGASALRDSDGRRIGTVLTSDVLNSSTSIAAAMGVTPPADLDLANFVRGVANMRTTDAVRNALTEGTNTAGGYTVPSILLPGVLSALAPASSLVAAGASIALVQDQAKSFTVAGVDSLPTAAWRAESGAVAESDPAFRSLTVTPRSLAFRFKVSRELLADSPNLEDVLRQVIAQAFAKELDRAGLRGSGTAPEIRGLLNIPGVNAIASGANGATLAGYAKFINASRAIKELNAPAPNAAIMSPRDEETVALFVDSTGQPLRRPEALAAWNFYTSSQIPTNLTVGTSNNCSEIYVGDFSQFVYFIREGVSIQLATELHAATGEVGFICHTRVDVAALYPQAFAVITGVKP